MSEHGTDSDARPGQGKGQTQSSMMRIVVWLQIIVVFCLLGYSTYSLFKGDFEQAFLPYPVLIIYYLLIARTRPKGSSQKEGKTRV